MRYAYFDPVSKAVLGWIDTNAFDYPSLPDPSTLFQITSDADWHDGDGKRWFLIDGALIDTEPPPPPAPPPSDTQLAQEARANRNGLLAQSDWIVMRHRDQLDGGATTSLTAAQFKAWLTYRQALRDVPNQANFPQSVSWPSRPN
ncbi:phage tail assembly chaperone [Ralstonia pickettii]|nr:phage tail assembly chaperone [Ralstonia pickettii]